MGGWEGAVKGQEQEKSRLPGGSGQITTAGNLSARCLPQAGDGGGAGELQKRDRRGGHVSHGGHQQENDEAQTNCRHQRLIKICDNIIPKLYQYFVLLICCFMLFQYT